MKCQFSLPSKYLLLFAGNEIAYYNDPEFDFETTNVYHIEVVAADSLYVSIPQNLTVWIQDTNDVPLVGFPNNPLILREDIPISTILMQVLKKRGYA